MKLFSILAVASLLSFSALADSKTGTKRDPAQAATSCQGKAQELASLAFNQGFGVGFTPSTVMVSGSDNTWASFEVSFRDNDNKIAQTYVVSYSGPRSGACVVEKFEVKH